MFENFSWSGVNGKNKISHTHLKNEIVIFVLMLSGNCIFTFDNIPHKDSEHVPNIYHGRSYYKDYILIYYYPNDQLEKS